MLDPMSIRQQILQRLRLTRPRLAVRRASLRTIAPVYRITDEGRISFGSPTPRRRTGAWLVALVVVAGAGLIIRYL